MALDGHLNFEMAIAIFFGVAFGEDFTRISLCLYSASNPHSLMPCLLTDQNLLNTFCSCPYSERSPHSLEPCLKTDENVADTQGTFL